MTQTFRLTPFSDESNQTQDWQNLDFSVTLGRSENALALKYQLQGDLSLIFFPNIESIPLRQDNLWKTTCFEFFISPRTVSSYYEVNLSPNGSWNVYRFDSYRQGMATEKAIQQLTHATKMTASEMTLNCHFPLAPLALTSKPLQISITAVLAHRSGDTSYWATKHVAAQADFHHRDSFMIAV
jgi:hypothetical protein